MNLILFEPHEIERPLPREDPRARHILQVLRRRTGDVFDAGIINGARGKGMIKDVTPESLALGFVWGGPPAPPVPLGLIIGLPRPQTARDILRDATSLGATALHFVVTEKGDPNYAQSTLWTSEQWRRQLIAGAEQAFDPRLPEVSHGRTLAEALAVGAADAVRLALDNYESPTALSECRISGELPVMLAIGAERGWSSRERAALREHGFQLTHLGSRVLRTETAVVAALSIIRAKLGLM